MKNNKRVEVTCAPRQVRFWYNTSTRGPRNTLYLKNQQLTLANTIARLSDPARRPRRHWGSQRVPPLHYYYARRLERRDRSGPAQSTAMTTPGKTHRETAGWEELVPVLEMVNKFFDYFFKIKKSWDCKNRQKPGEVDDMIFFTYIVFLLFSRNHFLGVWSVSMKKIFNFSFKNCKEVAFTHKKNIMAYVHRKKLRPS